MNFQNLVKVETADFYLGLAFRKAQERAGYARERKARNNLEKSKFIETEKITTISQTLTSQLQNILTCFPSIDQLEPFYLGLIKVTLDYAQLKKSLGALNWCVQKVKDFSTLTIKNIRLSRDITAVNNHRRAYYGRVASLLRQIKPQLEYLEKARIIMKNYPSIKAGCPTVAIAGFPNVGKSTLLKKLTSAKPEIAAYAFTTKSLNLGYFPYKTKKIQFIDTPGTLNRFEKMNAIEQQAYLAIEYCAELIVYVFDLTEQAANIQDQKKLFAYIKKFQKPVLIYFSKADLLPQETLAQFIPKGFSDPELIQQAIIKKLKL